MNTAAFISIILLYIDPGTGSMLLQLLLGGIASLWFVFKLWGRQIMKRLGMKPKEKEDNSKKS
jgi:hypothetical protein